MPTGIETEHEVVEKRIDKAPYKVLVNEKITELYGWTANTLKSPVPDNDYGRKWANGVNQYFKEAAGYRLGGIGGLSKLDHLINMIKLDLPSFRFESRGYINSNALRVLKACVEHDDLGIAGAASTGKTYPVGAYILQDWKSAPGSTLSFVCTTSLAASEDRIWGAIVKMFLESKFKIGSYIAHKYVIAFGNFSESASERDYNSAIKALAIPTGQEGKKAIGTLRGRKNKNVRLVYDELPEMETYVTEGAVNLEANTRDNDPAKVGQQWGLQVIGIGNPNNVNDAHGQMLRPNHPMGFKAIGPHTPEWETRTGHAIFLNGEWSPNFEATDEEPVPFPQLTNRVGLAKMLKRCHGNRNAIEYWRNAIGFWPTGTVTKTILTEELITQKEADKKIKWQQVLRRIVCGFDLGFTAGGDKCVANFGEIGRSFHGRMTVQWLVERIYYPEVGEVFEDSIAKQLVKDCIKYKVKPADLGIDISGDGGKMLSAIIRYWIKSNKDASEVFPISSMGAPTERLVSNVDKRKCDEAFDRRVTEYWMMVREGVMCEVIKGIPLVNENGQQHEIVEQLCAREYNIKNKKAAIETKDDYKERTKKGSPDHADSFVYMVEMARRAGLTFTTPDDEHRREERREERLENRTDSQEDAYESGDWGEDDEFAAAA